MRKAILLIVALVVIAAVGVYYFVPVIQPCALLSRVLPAWLLPPNPIVADLDFVALPGAHAIIGECACSGYRIEVPDGDKWNGDLVVYAHGFRGATPKLTVTNLPVRELAIAQGFAWAASSYRANGFNPQDGVADTLLLVEEFKKKVGAPKQVFIYGSSMGGFVVVDSLERHADVYVGGVAECGILGGAGQLDYTVGLNTAADYLAGVDMYAAGNKGLAKQRALLREKVYPALGAPPDYTFDENGLKGAVEPAPRMELTERGKAFREVEINLGGGSRAFAEEGFAAAYKLNFESVRALYALQPRGAVAAASNEETVYEIGPGLGVTSEEINGGIHRVKADPEERALFSFTGRLRAPLLTINDTGDLFVPLTNARMYRRLADAQGSGNMLVERSVRRFLHCDFTDAERERAFNDLVGWTRTGTRPEGEDLSGSLRDTGRKWTEPLRPDDPGFTTEARSHGEGRGR